MAVLLAGIAVLVPLVITPGLLFYFDVTPKATVLMAGTALAALWSAASRRDFTHVTARREGRWFGLLAGAALLSLAISTVFSTNPALSLTGTNWRRFGCVAQAAVLLFALIAAAEFARRPEGVRVLLRAVSAAGLVVAVYATLQYSGVDPLLPAQAYHVGEGEWTIVRPPATLGHASYFATWMLFALFWSVGQAMTETSAVWRAVARLTVVAGSAAIVLSGTRAGILGLAAGGVWLLVWRRVGFTRRVAVAVLALAVCGAVFYFAPWGLKLRSRTRWYVEDPRGGARLWLWRDTAAMAASRWAAGYGPETFTATFHRVESEDLAKAYPDFYHESPHNMFLDAAAAQGLPGLLVLAAIAALGFAAARRAKGPLPSALAASLAAAVVSQQFTVFITPTALYFYLTVALLVAQAPAALPGRAVTHARWAMVAVAVALCGFALRLSVADRYLELARQDIQAGSVTGAAAHYARYRRWQPPGATSDLWYSRSMAAAVPNLANPVAKLQARREAGQAALRATRTAEDPHNAWYNLAGFYALENDPARTERSLRTAIAWSPAWFKPHWTLAQVLRLGGRWSEAEAEAARAAALNNGRNPEVGATFDRIRGERQRTNPALQK